ncbi:ras-related protein Rab-17 isoform X2 [Lithobates pipiens]
MEHDIISEERAVYTYKLVLLGSSGVGKSSIVVRYLRDEFRDTDCTTGCAFFTQRVYHQGKPLNFEIWDTAGQERYHSVCNLYYRGSSAALLVYDITSKETFIRAQLWLQELRKYDFSEEMVIALIGNKTDLNSKRKVSHEPVNFSSWITINRTRHAGGMQTSSCKERRTLMEYTDAAISSRPLVPKENHLY